MKRRVTAICILLLAGTASAQTVYKCRDHKGQPVYQSFPCGGTLPAEKVWTGDYRQPTNAERWATYNRDQEWKARQQREAQHRPVYWSSGQVDTKASMNRAACAASRSEYNRVQADFILNRNIELLRKLESDIRRYCEVRP